MSKKDMTFEEAIRELEKIAVSLEKGSRLNGECVAIGTDGVHVGVSLVPLPPGAID